MTAEASEHGHRHAELEARLGYFFADPALLEEALTHASAVNSRHRSRRNNEQMEFLGDRVLGLAVATRLYVTRIDLEPEGDTWFPEVDWSQWRLLDERRVDDEPGATAPYRIMLYERAEGAQPGP
jgi:dsRNA-specific ribonuclease